MSRTKAAARKSFVRKPQCPANTSNDSSKLLPSVDLKVAHVDLPKENIPNPSPMNLSSELSSSSNFEQKVGDTPVRVDDENKDKVENQVIAVEKVELENPISDVVESFPLKKEPDSVAITSQTDNSCSDEPAIIKNKQKVELETSSIKQHKSIDKLVEAISSQNKIHSELLRQQLQLQKEEIEIRRFEMETNRMNAINLEKMILALQKQ